MDKVWQQPIFNTNIQTQSKQKVNTKRRTASLHSTDSSAVVEISLHTEA